MAPSTIVYVEDEPAIRAAVAGELIDAGYVVVETDDGEAGLDAILRHRPDLVICDWLMPNMSGFEMLGALRNDHQNQTPVIFLSAHGDPHYVEQGHGQGALAYLTKPVDFGALLAIVGDVLGAGER